MDMKCARVGLFLLQIGTAALAGTFGQWASALNVGVTMKEPPSAGSSERIFREIAWADLVPKGWNPAKEFKDLNFDSLRDGDPRANAMLKKMREILNNAPTNAEFNGTAVKIPGYLVPLEESKGEIREFLLVPYFGACIHTPPPPANQIIHVKMTESLKDMRSMSAIWVSGTIRTFISDTAMGVSGYRMEGLVVTPYRAPQPPQ